MNELEIKNLWLAINEKLEKSFVINVKNTKDIAQIKAHSLLGSMKPIKIFTILAGLLWVGGGVFVLSPIYVHAYSQVSKFFLFSATTQILLTAIALFIYIYQLVLIYEVEITDSILKTQERLARLKLSTLWVTRILFLQLPVWTTFWWTGNIFTDWPLVLILVQFFITGVFTFVAVWLFINIRYENRNKKWFRLIFEGKEWTPLMKSIEVLGQIEAYKSDK